MTWAIAADSVVAVDVRRIDWGMVIARVPLNTEFSEADALLLVGLGRMLPKILIESSDSSKLPELAATSVEAGKSLLSRIAVLTAERSHLFHLKGARRHG